MSGMNLIPMSRREARRGALAKRRWLIAGGAYATVLLAGLGSVATAWDTDRGELDQELEHLARSAESHSKHSKVLAGKIQSMKRTLEANEAVTKQPDWSIFLALLPQTLGDAVLRRVKVEAAAPLAAPAAKATETAKPDSPPGQAKLPAAPAGIVVVISAVAKDQTTPSDVVLRLEETGLFDQVKLMGTNREPSPKGVRIVFDIECRIGGRKR